MTRSRLPASFAALLLAFALCACGSTPGGDPERNQEPEAGVPPGLAAQQYHESQLQQLHDAHRAGDWERMEQILSLPRTGGTDEQHQRYAIYAGLMRGLRAVQDQLAVRGFTTAKDGDARDFEMDADLELALVLEPKPGHTMLLRASGQQGARTLITVRASIEDFRADGTSTRFEEPIVRGLSGDVTMRAGEPLRLPLQEPAAPGPDVLVRVVRFSGGLRPAGLLVDDEDAMTLRVPLAPFELRRFPKGFGTVRKNPSLILTNALVDPLRYLGHVFVASWFLSESGSAEERDKAMGQLIELLRSGPQGSHRCARACLTRLAGDQAPGARDRESWLTWWSLRRR